MSPIAESIDEYDAASLEPVAICGMGMLIPMFRTIIKATS